MEEKQNNFYSESKMRRQSSSLSESSCGSEGETSDRILSSSDSETYKAISSCSESSETCKRISTCSESSETYKRISTCSESSETYKRITTCSESSETYKRISTCSESSVFEMTGIFDHQKGLNLSFLEGLEFYN